MAAVRTTLVKKHTDLDVFKLGFATAMKVFEVSKPFPNEETYSLTDQIRRSSRSICANIAEAWRKRRYEAAFVAKLNDSETEAAETQVWLQFAVECRYVKKETARELYRELDRILGMLVNMQKQSSMWTIKSGTK